MLMRTKHVHRHIPVTILISLDFVLRYIVVKQQKE